MLRKYLLCGVHFKFQVENLQESYHDIPFRSILDLQVNGGIKLSIFWYPSTKVAHRSCGLPGLQHWCLVDEFHCRRYSLYAVCSGLGFPVLRVFRCFRLFKFRVFYNICSILHVIYRTILLRLYIVWDFRNFGFRFRRLEANGWDAAEDGGNPAPCNQWI